MISPKDSSTASDKPEWTKRAFTCVFGVLCQRILKGMFEKKVLDIESPDLEVKQKSWSSKKKEVKSVKAYILSLMQNDPAKKAKICEIMEEEFEKAKKPEIVNAGVDADTPSGEESIHILARCLHTMKEPHTLERWVMIYGVVPENPNQERAALDDKRLRHEALYKYIVDCINKPNDPAIFDPQNNFTHNARLAAISPNLVPRRPLTVQRLKDCMNKVRGTYTTFVSNFHKSGDLEEDADHSVGDDLFYEKFCSDSNPIYLYMYLLFDRDVPALLSREAPVSNQLEEGVGSKRKMVNQLGDTNQPRSMVLTATPEEMARQKEVDEARCRRDDAFAKQLVSETERSLLSDAKAFYYAAKDDPDFDRELLDKLQKNYFKLLTNRFNLGDN